MRAVIELTEKDVDDLRHGSSVETEAAIERILEQLDERLVMKFVIETADECKGLEWKQVDEIVAKKVRQFLSIYAISTVRFILATAPDWEYKESAWGENATLNHFLYAFLWSTIIYQSGHKEESGYMG